MAKRLTVFIMGIAGCTFILSTLTLVVAKPADPNDGQSSESQSVPPDDAPASLIVKDDISVTIRSAVMVPPTIGGAIWKDQGPGPTKNGQIENVIPDNEVVGAVHTVAAHPTDPNILYIGAVNGGIWKTTNATVGSPIWTPLIDSLPSLSIGALEFDPTDATHMTLVAGVGRYSSFARIGPSRTGILRTTDGGSNWTQLDGGGFLIGKNISGVAARGSVIVVSVNFSNPNNCADLGIFRSVDGGVTFTHISGSGAGLPSSRSYDLVGDPTNSNTLYTVVDCAEACDVGGNGIYKSTDTGATWAIVSNASMDSLITCGNTSNVEMAVGNSSEVYAAILNFGQLINGGLFRSGNGGTTWTQMDNPIMPDGTGKALANATNASPIVITSIGHGLISGTLVNISGVTGNTAANGLFSVTVLTSDDFSLNGSAGNGAYAGGGQWTRVVGVNPRFKPSTGDPFEPGGQGSIHFSMVADPNNANIVYIGGDRQDSPFPNFIGAVNFSGNLWRGDASIAATGGALSPQWAHLTHRNDVGAIPGGGTASSSSPHADSREMVFDANGNLIETDDGGIYRRTSPANNLGDWFSINGILQTTEMHDVAYDTITNTIFGGNQDTGTAFQRIPGGVVWDNEFTSGDGGDVAVDVVTLAGSNQSIRYTSAQNLQSFTRSIWDSSNNVVSISFPSVTVVGGGASLGVSFKTPVELNAIDPTRLVIGGTNSVYESLDQADTIREVGPGIGVNNFDSDPIAYGGRSGGVDNLDVLYIGSGSDVYIRTAADPSPLMLSAYPGRMVRDIVLDPNDWQIAYVIDTNGRVWQTTNSGVTWTNITGDLTGVGALYSIEFMNNTELVTGISDFVVVGSDRGVHVSDTGSVGMWNQLGTNLPNAAVYDLDYDPADDVLVASTMGRGAWVVAPSSVCGDGVVEGFEVCDDNNAIDGDGCSSTCIPEIGFSCTGQPSICTAICGDGLVLGIEICDDGFTDDCGTCNTTCSGVGTGSICGDNEVCAETEECDDGNTVDGDTCPSNCLFNTVCDRALPASCAASIIIDNSLIGIAPNPNYSCASGSNHTGTRWYEFTATATSARLSNCNSVKLDSTYAVYDGSCGALVEIGCSEDDFACATGDFLGDLCITNLIPGNQYYIQFSAWSAGDLGEYTLDIRCPCTCGDGVIDAPDETCDDGGESSTCNTNCTDAICGDGILNQSAGEVCDDGNTNDCDGCRGDCSAIETGCGDGFLCGVEVCDDGNTDLCDGCDAVCEIENCDDGIACTSDSCDLALGCQHDETACVEPPVVLAGEAGFSKDRYVSIDATTNGTKAVATRVLRIGSTTDKFVDCTSLQDKGTDGFYVKLIDGPLPAPGNSTFYCEYSSVTTALHIRGCNIVPGNMYDITMTADGTIFSSALLIPTTSPEVPTREFGDVLGVFNGTFWTAPDGIVTTNDIVGVIKKFIFEPGAPIIARVDNTGAVPNTLVVSDDVLRSVLGFAGSTFGSGVTGCLTGTCVPPTGSCE